MMRRSILFVLVAPSLLAGRSANAQRGPQAATPLPAMASEGLPYSGDQLEVRVFPLKNLAAADAARLVAPYMQWRNTGVFDAGAAIRGITVRAPKATLNAVDSLLKMYDRPPVTLVLQFKVIAALDSAVHDAAIAEIDAALRGMFRFGGYRLVAQATTTVNENSSYEMNLDRGGVNYQLTGWAGATTGTGTSASEQLTVRLSGWLPVPSVAGGSQLKTIVSTGLTIPVGQTVVVGGSAGSGDGRSLILAVRADLSAKQ